MLGLIMDYPLTLQAILRRAEKFSGSTEIVSRLADGSIYRYTYADMILRAKKLAIAFKELGVGPGDRIATLAWNHHQHLEAYFAVPMIGAVLHTLNLRLHPNDLTHIVNDAGDRIVIVDKGLWPLFEQLRPRINVEHVVVMANDGDVPEGTIEYERLLADRDAADFQCEELDERSAAAMCYTSGTTGHPKGVLFSHRAIVLESMNWTAADTVGVRQRDVILAVVPMFHINGWGIPFTAALVGAKLVLPGAYLDAPRLLELIQAERVTVSGGVPTVWSTVLQTLDSQPARYDITHLRTLVIGGSAVPKALLRGYRERYGVMVIHAWGMTETTAVATVCRVPASLESAPTETQDDWLAQQGLPMPFVEIRARGESGLAPWDGQTMGELEVRGPTVASAYYNSVNGTASFTPDQWFRTGDIVTINERGCVELRDRSKDLIKSGGEWISSVALENALMCHSAVAEAAVVAVPHPKWQERPLAVVVVKAGHRTSADELRQHLAPEFAQWCLPDAFEFVEEIPRTSTGKFLKSVLRDRFKNYYQAKDGSYKSNGSNVSLPDGRKLFVGSLGTGAPDEQ